MDIIVTGKFVFLSLLSTNNPGGFSAICKNYIIMLISFFFSMSRIMLKIQLGFCWQTKLISH